MGEPGPAAANLPALSDDARRWTRWLAPLGSLALLVLSAHQALKLGPEQVKAAFAAPGFVAAILALYLVPPAADWLIFRRLWNLPARGIPVILAKRIVNELFVSYAGELYFYLWARRCLTNPVASFGAVKDVNILSAVAGASFALVLLLPALPHMSALGFGRFAPALAWSSLGMLGVSLTIFILARRLFTLSRPKVLEVLAIHLVRLAAGVGLCAWAWSLALPQVPIGAWLALSALRLLVALVPVAPNRELLFAGLTGVVAARGGDVAGIVALTATTLAALHLVAGLGVGAVLLVFPERAPLRSAP